MKRGVELLVAASGLVLLSPLLLATAVAIRLTMGSPVLFRQARAGLDGRVFTIVKFRTMRSRRSDDEPDSARETPIGRLLRMSSLDELPQLWNVLRGDMGVIGPRPTLPEQVLHYTARQRRRLSVRPGLTGWAQVNGRNSLSWPERIELDLFYVDNRTLSLDLKILLRTVTTLLRPSSVYGPGGVNHKFPLPDAAVPRNMLELRGDQGQGY